MPNLLFVHGILGKPDYFDFLRPCVPDDFGSTDILLEGHGGSPGDFSRASMTRWRSQVSDTVDTLRKSGEKLMIVSHSMGTLFAIGNAVAGKADALFLLNPPLRLRVTRRLITTPLKVLSGKNDDKWTKAAREAYSILDDPNVFHYIGWVPRYLELFREIRRTRSLMGGLEVPVRAYLSAHDEMVAPASGRLFPRRQDVKVTILPDSGHYYYADADRATIMRDFSEFLPLSMMGKSDIRL